MPEIIVRDFNGQEIGQRADGYLNATAMCKAAGKEWKAYNRLDGTSEFLTELSRSVKISTDHLITTITKGPNAGRGTWVHPHVGYHLAQWCSPAFAVQVAQWIDDIRTKGYATAPGVDPQPQPYLDANKLARQMAAIMDDKLAPLTRRAGRAMVGTELRNLHRNDRRPPAPVSLAAFSCPVPGAARACPTLAGKGAQTRPIARFLPPERQRLRNAPVPATATIGARP